MPCPIGNLVTKPGSGTGSAAFLFQPAHLVPFAQAWAWQRHWQGRLLEEADLGGDPPAEAVWLLQHPPCYTLGRSASEGHLLFDPQQPPAPLHRIDRGGEVTYHSPGQLVIYPVLDLHRHCTDLHWYLRQLEQVVIDVMASLGLRGERLAGLTGVWLDQCKVAAIGVGCRRWITQHGVALNVSCAMDGFEAVVPCGLTGRAVGRLSDWIPGLSVSDVQPLVGEAMAARFGLRWKDSPSTSIAEGPGW